MEDRSEEIRIKALKIITYLHRKQSSALIIPYLKKFTFNIFLHLTTNFKYFPEKKYLINSLTILISEASSIIDNHIDELLEILLSYLKDRKNYEGMEILFFETFYQIIKIFPNYVLPYVENICFHVLEALKDRLNP